MAHWLCNCIHFEPRQEYHSSSSIGKKDLIHKSQKNRLKNHLLSPFGHCVAKLISNFYSGACGTFWAMNRRCILHDHKFWLPSICFCYSSPHSETKRQNWFMFRRVIRPSYINFTWRGLSSYNSSVDLLLLISNQFTRELFNWIIIYGASLPRARHTHSIYSQWERHQVWKLTINVSSIVSHLNAIIEGTIFRFNCFFFALI